MSTNFLGGGVVLDGAGRPLDQIVLTGVTATGHHGVFEHERREGQVFRADVVVHLDTRRAAATDDLARTVNYGVLAEAVAGVLAGEPADLVETVAERIAATALADPAIAAVDVAVHKPQAPITVPFDDVVVRIHRDRHKLPAAEPWRRPAEPAASPRPVEEASGAAATSAPQPQVAAATPSQPTPGVGEPDRLDEAPPAPVEAVLALGGNVGTPQGTLREAVADVERIGGVEIVAVSPLARTAPVGGPGQPDYLNAVVIVSTTLAPRALLHAVQAIELRHGRERLERWGPRTLDIDLITYGSTLAVTDDLELPHPRAHERAFVLQPWAQVAPDAVLPGLGGGPVAALAATAPDRDGVRWMALDWMTAPLPSGPRPHDSGAHAVAPEAGVPAGAPEQAVPDVGPPSGDPDVGTPSGDPDAAADDVAPTDDPEVAPDAGDDPHGGPDPDHDAPDAGAPADDPATRDPLDWLPALPTPGTSGTSGTGEQSGTGSRSPIFSPVVAPDDVPHPGDRQS